MTRRFDSLSRMFLTLLAALLVGAVLEADGLRIWADRLETGVLRDAAVPVTRAWHGLVSKSGGEVPRGEALELKSRWADAFTGKDVTGEPVRPREVPDPPEWTAAQNDVPVTTVAPVQSAPAQVAQRELLIPVSAGAQIVLAGDSMMAVGLAPVLRRSLSAGGGVQVIKAYRSGTGLARPEVFDWLQHYPVMLGETQPAVVICSLGANDGQNVQSGKQVLAFGSAAWDEFYRARLTAYLDLLTRNQTRVLWVGMPAMRAPSFARKMQHMNALVQDVLTNYPSVTWLDPNPVLSSESQNFTQFRSNERGKLIKLRADDGIHMTDEGAAFLLPGIRAWLEQQQILRPDVQAALPAQKPRL